jgi:hypothetical protein
VAPHQQTNPNGTQRDNYSATGNVPPNTRRRGGYGMQRDVYHKLYGRHRLPAQDAIRFGYGNVIQGGEVCIGTATTRAVLTIIWGLHIGIGEDVGPSANRFSSGWSP